MIAIDSLLLSCSSDQSTDDRAVPAFFCLKQPSRYRARRARSSSRFTIAAVASLTRVDHAASSSPVRPAVISHSQKRIFGTWPALGPTKERPLHKTPLPRLRARASAAEEVRADASRECVARARRVADLFERRQARHAHVEVGVRQPSNDLELEIVGRRRIRHLAGSGSALRVRGAPCGIRRVVKANAKTPGSGNLHHGGHGADGIGLLREEDTERDTRGGSLDLDVESLRGAGVRVLLVSPTLGRCL
jgi:hypothetical protein